MEQTGQQSISWLCIVIENKTFKKYRSQEVKWIVCFKTDGRQQILGGIFNLNLYPEFRLWRKKKIIFNKRSHLYLLFPHITQSRHTLNMRWSIRSIAHRRMIEDPVRTVQSVQFLHQTQFTSTSHQWSWSRWWVNWTHKTDQKHPEIT